MGVLGALIRGEHRGRPAARENYTQTGLARTVGSGRAARLMVGEGWQATAKQTAVGIAHGAAKVWVGADRSGASAAPPQAYTDTGDGTTTEGDTLVRRTQRLALHPRRTVDRDDNGLEPGFKIGPILWPHSGVGCKRLLGCRLLVGHSDTIEPKRYLLL